MTISISAPLHPQIRPISIQKIVNFSFRPPASMAAGTMITGAGERKSGLTSCLGWKRLDQYSHQAFEAGSHHLQGSDIQQG